MPLPFSPPYPSSPLFPTLPSSHPYLTRLLLLAHPSPSASPTTELTLSSTQCLYAHSLLFYKLHPLYLSADFKSAGEMHLLTGEFNRLSRATRYIRPEGMWLLGEVEMGAVMFGVLWAVGKELRNVKERIRDGNETERVELPFESRFLTKEIWKPVQEELLRVQVVLKGRELEKDRGVQVLAGVLGRLDEVGVEMPTLKMGDASSYAKNAEFFGFVGSVLGGKRREEGDVVAGSARLETVKEVQRQEDIEKQKEELEPLQERALEMAMEIRDVLKKAKKKIDAEESSKAAAAELEFRAGSKRKAPHDFPEIDDLSTDNARAAIKGIVDRSRNFREEKISAENKENIDPLSGSSSSLALETYSKKLKISSFNTPLTNITNITTPQLSRPRILGAMELPKSTIGTCLQEMQNRVLAQSYSNYSGTVTTPASSSSPMPGGPISYTTSSQGGLLPPVVAQMAEAEPPGALDRAALLYRLNLERMIREMEEAGRREGVQGARYIENGDTFWIGEGEEVRRVVLRVEEREEGFLGGGCRIA